MSDFLLIHGSCHGAWCWRDVIAALQAAGHHARAIDLPSHGADPTPIAQVTLDRYAEAILAAIDMPVTLVGHSMAGLPISAAAEKAPEKIARLIYLCAYAPRSGMSVASMRRAGPRQPLRDAIVIAPDRQSFTFDPALTADRLYHDCTEAARAFAASRLGPQPILPQEQPVTLTARYHSVPKHYIRCLQDRAIPPEYQAAMTEGWPEGTVSTLDASHSPFLSCPEALARRLIEVAA
ncbi:alpha/beta fold hydrolase [Cereibacter sphaeroides]|uniref:alpha/beta fold hydrolase n=1 Tax=Cereibacter sphaeroides TaxID=1063 RepID=UPI001F3261AA|nr:alpha/beta fold hydrolase [Cereibacter sphaeroides]MCE6961339.1 alpha/beta fold hydrolase [Cereibacter sphaeroides]MCE6973980.1 alpha/beta fold hydrolase [Cereibacter sphaeroides]